MIRYPQYLFPEHFLLTKREKKKTEITIAWNKLLFLFFIALENVVRYQESFAHR